MQLKEQKICTKHNELKYLCGIKYLCRSCSKERSKETYRKNKERVLARTNKYHAENKEKMDNWKKDYYLNNKEAYATRSKLYYLEKRGKYKEENKESERIRKMNYRLNNKAKLNLSVVNNRKKNITARLAHCLRSRLYKFLKGKQKSGSHIKDLGCTLNELKTHLERQFTDGMDWSNYGSGEGKWNIDHKVPLSILDLTDPEQLKIACNYMNLQPLWHVDNMKKE